MNTIHMKYTSFNDIHLMREFEGDEDILLEMIQLFQSGLSELLLPIRESILSKDAAKLKVSAHTIKGVLSNFYADKGSNIAAILETRGAQSIFDDAMELLNQLENQLMLLLYELQNLEAQLIKQS